MIKRETIERENFLTLAPKGRRLICHADQFWGLGQGPVPTSIRILHEECTACRLAKTPDFSGIGGAEKNMPIKGGLW